MTLAAGRDLAIHAAESSSGASSASGKISASVGIGATAGTDGVGFGYKGNLGLSGKVEDSDAHFYQNAKILAGANLTTISGQDTTIIAAVNDNLKLDTGTLSYENVVGKTTQTSTGWGINWHYETEDKAANNKGNAANKGNNGDANPSAGGQTAPKGTNNTGADKTDSASAEQDKEKAEGDNQTENESNKYEHLPQWAGSIFKKTDGMKDDWSDWEKDIMFSPAAFTYARSESTQTAYATIGKGEITVRNNPGQSLDGLNRDPNNAMQTNSSQDFSITVSPLFDKISDALGLYGYPATLDKVAFWLTDPKGAWADTKTHLEKSLPFLKPAQQAAPAQADTQH